MKRSDVIQSVLDLFDAPSYLEIGVDYGETFHNVKAARKVAVDPVLKFDVQEKRALVTDAECEYFDTYSDVYFAKFLKPGEKFDLVFIDGLHTFDQTLKDLLNAMSCLKDDGIIIVDDVYPTSFAASIPNLDLLYRYLGVINSTDATWMGDVYKVVLFVKQFLTLFSYATVKENHGQMIIWRKQRETDQASIGCVEAISRAEYLPTVLDREHFNILPFAEIEQMLRSRKIL